MSQEERLATAKNPQTPVNVLEQLSKDTSAQVREAVAQNVNTPRSVLEELSRA